jgi:hypothetical protein
MVVVAAKFLVYIICLQVKNIEKRLFIGFMVKTQNDGNVRSFAMTMNDIEETHLRSNRRHDDLLDLKLLHE